MPAALAMVRVLQCVSPFGVVSRVFTITASTASSDTVRGAPTRGSSYNPASRLALNRSRHLATVVFVVSWQYIPFHSLLYQGGVRQIPVQLYEAAELDGAGRIRQFFSITLPQLKYTIITSSTLMIVGSVTFFDLIFVLTEGGPGDATRTLALDMYKRGFQANLMGPASAIAVVLVLVGLAIALLLRRLGGRDAGASQLEGAG